MRPVVRLTASATSALPRSLLLAICVIYASFGLFGRDPWKNEDAAGFGVMWTMANGTWHEYTTLEVKPGETLRHEFPAGFAAHWVRVAASENCKATAIFHYE